MEYGKRFVALGDSFTEGVGDDDPSRPNGARGWADRVAEQLCAADPGWGYANLAIRGKKIRQVVDEQLPAALELKPTLASLYAGGNDILRPSVDIDELMEGYAGAVAALRASGAEVLLFTGFDSAGSAVFGKTRGRTAIYNEWVREIAERHGAVIADYWRWREFQDWRYWARDRLHMGTPGHTLMAKKVLEVLRASDAIRTPELEAAPALGRLAKLKADAAWGREHVLPWVKRRLTGTSSGDALTAKYPGYVRLAP
ncbi:SGNH/GDSL hydrolase family protein [Zafaria sp. Z1313]|uniref:SGNH/GDSL hydrolase family protein n=1 Tax=unclassified Zafaria TaxID=2828765 RepID=UPI002E7957DF|nr:SGNH/GDSL hydrolase family protein [Zafaria sp. J156]MEE1622792.1 SGNH/GDSL hydrolase family protein [Zafaria sp. J156]